MSTSALGANVEERTTAKALRARGIACRWARLKPAPPRVRATRRTPRPTISPTYFVVEDPAGKYFSSEESG